MTGGRGRAGPMSRAPGSGEWARKVGSAEARVEGFVGQKSEALKAGLRVSKPEEPGTPSYHLPADLTQNQTRNIPA